MECLLVQHKTTDSTHMVMKTALLVEARMRSCARSLSIGQVCTSPFLSCAG